MGTFNCYPSLNRCFSSLSIPWIRQLADISNTQRDGVCRVKPGYPLKYSWCFANPPFYQVVFLGDDIFSITINPIAMHKGYTSSNHENREKGYTKGNPNGNPNDPTWFRSIFHFQRSTFTRRMPAFTKFHRYGFPLFCWTNPYSLLEINHDMGDRNRWMWICKLIYVSPSINPKSAKYQTQKKPKIIKSGK